MSVSKSFDLESVTSTPSSRALTIVQLLYGVPSFIAMISFLFLIAFSKNYANSFYRMVQVDLIVNIFCYFNTWFCLRFYEHSSSVQFLKSCEQLLPGVLSWSKYFSNFFLHMQFCPAIALSVHRLTSVYFPSRYQDFWSRWYLLIALFFTIYSVMSTWNGFTIQVSVINGTLTKYYDVDVYKSSFDRIAVFSICYFVIILSIGLSTSFLVSMKVKKLNLNDRGIGKKLTKIAVTYCAIYTGNLLWSVITALDLNLHFLPELVIRYRPIILVFASDMMTLALPYILLIHDSNIKNHALKVARWRSTVANIRIDSHGFFILLVNCAYFLFFMSSSEYLTSSLELTTDDRTVEILTVIQLAYGVPSFLLLDFFFFYLMRKAVYKRSFYRFIQLDLLVNILCYLNTWIGVRSFTHPIGISVVKVIERNFPGVLTFSRFLAFWFQHMQFCCTIGLSLNRLSSVIDHDNRFERMWSRWYPLYAVCACLYSVLPTVPTGVFTVRISLQDGVLMRSVRPGDSALALNIVAVFAVIYLVVLLILGPITSYKASQHFKIVSGTETGRNMQKEVGKRLTHISLTYCGVYTGNILWSVVTATDRVFPFLPDSIRNLQQTSLTFASDSMVLSLPYILVIFDTNVQRQLVAFVKRSTVTSVAAHISNSAIAN